LDHEVVPGEKSNITKPGEKQKLKRISGATKKRTRSTGPKGPREKKVVKQAHRAVERKLPGGNPTRKTHEFGKRHG